jgi:replicative DNA helicase
MAAEAYNVEDAIVSILLNNPDMILKSHIEPRWFYDRRLIIEKILNVASSGVDVDVFSVSTGLCIDNALSLLVGIQKDSFGAKSNYKFYLDKVKLKYEETQIRELIKKSYHALGNDISGTEVLSNLISESIAISSTDSKKSTYNTKEALGVFLDKLEEINDAIDQGGTGLKTDISSLDELMGGMHPSDMIIVGARPGAGKTAMAVSVMRNVAKKGKRIGFFSTEMSVFQVMGRFASIEASIDSKKLRSANLDDMDYSRLTAATSRIMGFDLRICDKPVMTIGEISMQSRAWAADGGIDFIVVDYLTRLHPDKTGANQNIDVGLIITGLKNIARNLNIPVMVLAQLNRSGAQRKDNRPVMTDLRDSGIIEQEADQILMLHRPSADDDDGEFQGDQIIIEKNRHGSTGIVRCDFDPSTMHWRDKEFSYAN